MMPSLVEAVINQFIQIAANQWAYLNQDGHKVTGLQTLTIKFTTLAAMVLKSKVNCSLSKVRNATLMPTLVSKW